MRLLHFALYLAEVFALSEFDDDNDFIDARISDKAAVQEIADTNVVYPALSAALSLFANRELKSIVATKTTPIQPSESSSNRILNIFSKMASEDTDLHLYELDNGEGATTALENENSPTNIHKIVGDTAQALRRLSSRIDLLYLDSSDSDPASQSADHRVMNLREVMSAYGRLHRGSVVIVDGCGVSREDKCGLAKLYLSELSWNIVYNGPQLVMAPSDTTLITE